MYWKEHEKDLKRFMKAEKEVSKFIKDSPYDTLYFKPFLPEGGIACQQILYCKEIVLQLNK